MWQVGLSRELISSGKPNMWLLPISLCLLYWSVLVEGNSLNRTMDPEAKLNSKQLIQHWGYPFKEYYVDTEDNYILNIFRISHGRENNSTTSPKPVVFLQHGLLVDASIWYQNLPHNSLAFMLADAGYDVWLGNSRGNTWSRNHTSLSPLFWKFWEFSYDQMAEFDLPACIDFVLQETGQQQLYYIGYSEGTTTAFIAFSSNAQLASKIKLYFALAPVATVKHARTPLAKLAALSETEIELLFGKRDFLPQTYFGSLVAGELCSQDSLASVCGNLLFVFCGFNEKNLNMSRVDVYASHFPAGTSVQNMIHWKQAVKSGKLQAYDYGRLGNMLHYNQDSPPEYNVSAMTVPTAIWSGGNDWVSGPEDVNQLIPQIPNLIYKKCITEWNHLDPVFGLDAPVQVYYEILKLLQENP